MAYRLAYSLATARAELDALYPRRPKTGQEGWIGNQFHVDEGWTKSDHNPWVTLAGIGIVRAWDIDCTATREQIDAGVSFDPDVLAEHLAALQRADFKAFGRNGYVIWNRRITYGGDNEGVWHEYRGSDPHDRHIHVSVGTNPSEFDDRESWGFAEALGRPTGALTTSTTDSVQEDDMATFIVLDDRDGKGYIGDMITRSWIPDEATLNDKLSELGAAGVRNPHTGRTYSPADAPNLRRVANPGAFGLLVGPNG